MVVDDSPLRVLVLGTRAPARAVIAGALAGFGHEVEQSWALHHALTLLVPGRFDAFITFLGPGQAPLRMLAQIPPQLGEPRTTAFIAIAPGLVHGQEEEVRRAGFDRLLVEPLPLPAMHRSVLDAALPLRPPPALDHALRAALRAGEGETALDLLEAAVRSAAERLATEEPLEAPAVTEAALLVGQACRAAGFPAAAAAAEALGAEPERPYRLRALGSALGAARVAARTERLRRGAERPI